MSGGSSQGSAPKGGTGQGLQSSGMGAAFNQNQLYAGMSPFGYQYMNSGNMGTGSRSGFAPQQPMQPQQQSPSMPSWMSQPPAWWNQSQGMGPAAPSDGNMGPANPFARTSGVPNMSQPPQQPPQQNPLSSGSGVPNMNSNFGPPQYNNPIVPYNMAPSTLAYLSPYAGTNLDSRGQPINPGDVTFEDQYRARFPQFFQ